MIGRNLCYECKRFLTDEQDRRTCEAFPDGIPCMVFTGRIPHRKPIKGDNGKLFVADPTGETIRRIWAKQEAEQAEDGQRKPAA